MQGRGEGKRKGGGGSDPRSQVASEMREKKGGKKGKSLDTLIPSVEKPKTDCGGRKGKGQKKDST